MADRYWRGLSTDLWDGTAGTKWAATVGGAGGAAVPTAADDVFFDGTSANCTISGSRVAKSINCTGYTGTLAGASTPALTISGSLTLVAGMTLTYAGTTTFNRTATLTSAGKTLGPIIMDTIYVGESLTLADALTCSGTLDLEMGVFSTSASNYSVTAQRLISDGGSPRTINLNGSTITLTAGTGSPTSGTIDFDTQTVDLTFNAGTSTIICSAATAWIQVQTGVTFYNVQYTSTAITLAVIAGANTFNNLTIAGRTTAGLGTLRIDGNQTITGTLTLSAGTNATMRTFVRSDTIGTTRTLTCAAVASLTDIDFRDITIAGAAAPVSGTRLGDCKGNSGITFDAAKTVYRRATGAVTNWSGSPGLEGWSFTNGGTADVTAFPLAQDTAVFPSSPTPYPPSGNTVSINASWNIGTIDMSARTSNTMTLGTGSNTPAIYGNWINGTGTTLTGTGVMTFAGRGSQTITSAGKTFSQAVAIISPGGSVTLQDAYTGSATSNTIQLQAGTFDANGYNVTLSGPFLANYTITRTAAIGSGTWTLSGATSGGVWNASTSTNLTVTGTGTISLTSASAKTFAGGGIAYTNITLDQGGAGALTITGSNTFGDITNSYAPTGATSILFTAGTTTTFGNWSASGTSGKLLTIGSVTTASHTLSKASGTVSADFLSISRSTATGGASWYAGANSTDGGNNSGWIFTAPPAAVTSGNFFFFFN